MDIAEAQAWEDQHMALKRKQPNHRKVTAGTERMLTMQEAMEYLSSRGVPCKSRATFYRILKDFNIQYVNINPHGTNEVRRFPPEALGKLLEAKGIIS